MKYKTFYISLPFIFAIMFLCCSNPVTPIDEHLEKLWEITLDGPLGTDITTTESFLLFKTQINITGKLYKVTKDGKNVRTASTGGCSFGSPKISNNIIYSNNCTGTLYALKGDDLSIIWSKSGFSWVPVPAVDDQYIYVTEEDRISALDKTTGNQIWSTEISGKNIKGPTIDKDNLYVVTSALFKDGYLYSINKADGSINYRKTIPYIEEKSQEGGSRVGVEIWNDLLYIAGDNCMFYCFNKNSGDIKWSFAADAPMEVTPKISDGLVYFGSLNRTCYALDAQAGKFKWSFQKGGSIMFEPSFYKNYVMYKASGALIILDKNSGDELITLNTSTTEFNFTNAFWDTDGKIYAGCFREDSDEESNQKFKLIAFQFR